MTPIFVENKEFQKASIWLARPSPNFSIWLNPHGFSWWTINKTKWSRLDSHQVIYRNRDEMFWKLIESNKDRNMSKQGIFVVVVITVAKSISRISRHRIYTLITVILLMFHNRMLLLLIIISCMCKSLTLQQVNYHWNVAVNLIWKVLSKKK